LDEVETAPAPLFCGIDREPAGEEVRELAGLIERADRDRTGEVREPTGDLDAVLLIVGLLFLLLLLLLLDVLVLLLWDWELTLFDDDDDDDDLDTGMPDDDVDDDVHCEPDDNGGFLDNRSRSLSRSLGEYCVLPLVFVEIGKLDSRA
jgi:hypothetical protein